MLFIYTGDLLHFSLPPFSARNTSLHYQICTDWDDRVLKESHAETHSWDARRHREATAGSTAKSLEHWQTPWRRMNWKSIRLVGHPSHKSSSSSREKKHSPPRRSTAPSCRLHRYGIWGWTWGINYTSTWQYSDKGKKMILIGLPVPLEDGCKETSVRKTTNYHDQG